MHVHRCVEAIYRYGDDIRDAAPAYSARKVFEERTIQFSTRIDSSAMVPSRQSAGSKSSKKVDVEKV